MYKYKGLPVVVDALVATSVVAASVLPVAQLMRLLATDAFCDSLAPAIVTVSTFTVAAELELLPRVVTVNVEPTAPVGLILTAVKLVAEVVEYTYV
jgi:hypothetical protein